MFDRLVERLCRSSLRHPGWWAAASLVLLLPALYSARSIRLDTDPVRLLPRDSRSARLTRELEPAVGERSFFYLLLEGDHPDVLSRALKESTAAVSDMEEVLSIEYRHPVDFFKKWRYLLIPSEYLSRIQDAFLSWESEVSPLGIDLLEEETGESEAERAEKRYAEHLMEIYADLPELHQSRDGRMRGIRILPRVGLHDIQQAEILYFRLRGLADRLADKYGIQCSVGGSLSRWIRGYRVVLRDIRRSGMVMLAGIVLVLLLSFRTLRVIPVLFFPLTVGLIWALGLTPLLVGDLNTITSFFLVVSFGLGIDFSLHLLKRYQQERRELSPQDALSRAFQHTGRSVAVSALTTSLAFFVLAFSGFRGTSEFGIVGGTALLTILAAMILFMPAVIVLGERFRLIPPLRPSRRLRFFPSPAFSLTLLFLVAAALTAAGFLLKFDYDFSRLGGKINEPPLIKKRQDLVYPTSLPPAAVYLARDIPALDGMLARLQDKKHQDPDTTLGWIRSLRDFNPDPNEERERRMLLADIRELAEGRWTRRLEDPDRLRRLREFRDWNPPAGIPALEDLPEELSRPLTARNRSDGFLIAVFTGGKRQNGRNAIAFTRELYSLQPPEGVRGPMGETPVIAEILMLVTREGPWLVLLAFAGIMGLILVGQRSFTQTLWLILPLGTGLALTCGLMGVLGIKINFYNIVVFPALLGMGVDDGVHFVRRWRETGRRTRKTFSEMLPVLTVTTVTTMLGYGGLTLAHHPGLYSIGVLACLGLGCTWFTTLFLLPGLLDAGRRRRGEH